MTMTFAARRARDDPHYLATRVPAAILFFRRMVVAEVVLKSFIGLGLLLAGPGRTSAPGYATMHALGGVGVWGAGALLAAGLTGLTWWARWFRALRVSLIVDGTIYLLLAIAFAQAAWTHPGGGLLIVGTFALPAFMCLALAVGVREPAP